MYFYDYYIMVRALVRAQISPIVQPRINLGVVARRKSAENVSLARLLFFGQKIKSPLVKSLQLVTAAQRDNLSEIFRKPARRGVTLEVKS
jgi:hypothetical protein